MPPPPPRTDEDNGLSNPHIVDMVLKEPALTVTLKLDGSSCTVVVEDGVILDVCSRNLSLLDDGKNGFWRAVKRLDLSKLPPGEGRTVLQGELMGPGVQGNQLKLTEPALYLFNVHTQHRGYFDHWQVEFTAQCIGAQAVPAVGLMLDRPALGHLQELADLQVLPDGSPAEGIVVRPAKALRFGNGRPAGFKIISRNYNE